MRYVALLRGINVGGNTMIKMETLREVFSGLGFENVRTYINSGNVAFDAGRSSVAKLVGRIENAIEERFGRTVEVTLRTRKDINRILSANPFDGQYASHKEMHVLFLKTEMPREKMQQLEAAALPGERYQLAGREIYCHIPAGVAGSLLTKGFFEKKPRVYITARNWRTVEQLAEL